MPSCSNDDGPKTYNGDVGLYSQEMVNEFGNQNYTSIEGNLVIADYEDDSYDITDLSPLNSLKVIEGNINVGICKELESINGFNNLEIAGSISFSYNDNLLSVSGFESLEIVNGMIAFNDNPNLINVDAFQNVKELENGLWFMSNTAL